MAATTAADLFWRALRREGVEVVFGHPGGAILPVYDALSRRGDVHHVLTRHEQAAAHAADGYARVTGRPGVCLATSGPGATNLVTGLATARMDSVPLVAVTGQVPLALLGTHAFQETDIVAVARPVTKRAIQVRDPDDVGPAVREAFDLACSGRPGPVLLDLPKCVQQGRVSREEAEIGARAAGPAAAPVPASVGAAGASLSSDGSGRGWAPDLERAVRLLSEARRPVVMAGRGIVLSGTSPELRRLAERCDLPVSTTLLGLDGFPAGDPRALGMPGMHGTERANRGIQDADLVLGLGLRFDDRVTGPTETFAPRARIVHFDVDPAAPGRTVAADVAVVGDLGRTLPALLRAAPPARRPEWWRRLEAWQRDVPPEPADPTGRGRLTGRRATRAVARRIAASRAVVASDVGQHQMWLAQELRDAEPRTHLTSGGLGTMGYALPAALGASYGAPGRPVWMVAGDGGFQMTLQELATVAQEGRPLRMVVVNNGFLGMVRQWQELFHGRRYSATELTGPDLVSAAGSYGISAHRATEAGELEDVLDRAEATDGPVLVELRVRREENVYPMVPAGAALHEMMVGPPEAVAG